MRRIGAVIALIVAGLAIAVVTGWGAGVLFYLGPGPEWVRQALAWAFVAGAIQSRRSMRVANAAISFFTIASARAFSDAGKYFAT